MRGTDKVDESWTLACPVHDQQTHSELKTYNDVQAVGCGNGHEFRFGERKNLYDWDVVKCQLQRNCTYDTEMLTAERTFLGYHLTIHVIERYDEAVFYRGVHNCSAEPLYGPYDPKVNSSFLFREHITLFNNHAGSMRRRGGGLAAVGGAAGAALAVVLATAAFMSPLGDSELLYLL